MQQRSASGLACLLLLCTVVCASSIPADWLARVEVRGGWAGDVMVVVFGAAVCACSVCVCSGQFLVARDELAPVTVRVHCRADYCILLFLFSLCVPRSPSTTTKQTMGKKKAGKMVFSTNISGVDPSLLPMLGNGNIGTVALSGTLYLQGTKMLSLW